MRITRPLHDEIRDLAHFAPVRPAVVAGLRAAVATVVPLLAGSLFGIPEMSWASLAGFTVALVDKGGAYRTRAYTMGADTLCLAVAVMIGGLIGGHPLLGVPALFLFVTACLYAHVYGAAATSIGNTTANTFAIALATPEASLEGALVRGGLVLAGGAWVMLLSLLLWPIRVYRPARLAVARCYREVGAYTADLERSVARHAASEWHPLVVQHHAQIRQALEEARATLAALRRGRQVESGRGERLLVLLEVADQMFAGVIALADVLEGLARRGELEPVRAPVVSAVAELCGAVREIARLIEMEESPAEIPTLAWSGEPVRAAAGGEVEGQYEHVAELLASLWEFAEIAGYTAASLGDEREARTLTGSALQHPEPRRSLLQPLREHLTPDSLVLRHALRAGFAAAAALSLTHLLDLKRGYWAVLTALIILQPYAGATRVKALQRVLGTVIGGILTALIASSVHSPAGIMGLVFLLTGLSVSVLPLNYGLYSIFLTPAFVLLAEVGAGDWTLAGARIVNTLLGGAIALAAAYLLWPRPERERFPELLAVALRANRDYLRTVIAAAAGQAEGSPAALAAARRGVGLATTNAEASFQRLLTESRGRSQTVEPLMTILVYLRRLTAAETALATGYSQGTQDALRLLDERAGEVLRELAEAVAGGTAPRPLPHLAGGHLTADPLLQPRIERVARQLTVLHNAVARLYGAAPDARGPLLQPQTT